MFKYLNLLFKERYDYSGVAGLPRHTQAKTVDQLMQRTKEVIKAYLHSGEEPEVSEKFVGIQQIEV